MAPGENTWCRRLVPGGGPLSLGVCSGLGTGRSGTGPHSSLQLRLRAQSWEGAGALGGAGDTVRPQSSLKAIVGKASASSPLAHLLKLIG